MLYKNYPDICVKGADILITDDKIIKFKLLNIENLSYLVDSKKPISYVEYFINPETGKYSILDQKNGNTLIINPQNVRYLFRRVIDNKTKGYKSSLRSHFDLNKFIYHNSDNLVFKSVPITVSDLLNNLKQLSL